MLGWLPEIWGSISAVSQKSLGLKYVPVHNLLFSGRKREKSFLMGGLQGSLSRRVHPTLRSVSGGRCVVALPPQQT